MNMRPSGSKYSTFDKDKIRTKKIKNKAAELIKKKTKHDVLNMGKQHMMFASYIAPAWFLKEPWIEREQSHQNVQYLNVCSNKTQNCFSFDWISSWTEFSICKVLWKLVFLSFLLLVYVQFIWSQSKNNAGEVAEGTLKFGCTLSIHSTDSWWKVFTCGLASSRAVKQSGPRMSGRRFGYTLSRWRTTLEGWHLILVSPPHAY